jgi:hypothetical protein
LLAQIRAEYDKWHTANTDLTGPGPEPAEPDAETVRRRVGLLEQYKGFLDQQEYAEHFDSRSNLHSTVLEEFLYYLFRDLVAGFGEHVLIGKSHTFKDIFFQPPNYAAMIGRPFATIERKDHDFVIGITVRAEFHTTTPPAEEPDDAENEEGIAEHSASYQAGGVAGPDTCLFDVPAVAIECKTYLDKTMLEGSSRAAEELKARNPNCLYVVVMEWLKLTDAVNLRKYKVDQIYVFRRQKNTDREFRFGPEYVKRPLDPDVVFHLFALVRSHVTSEWESGVKYGLDRGWLL